MALFARMISLIAVSFLPTALLPRLAAQADLLRELPAGRGIVGRDHRVVRGKIPPCAILVGRQVVFGRQVPLEHFHLLAAVEADEMVFFNRRTDRYCRVGDFFRATAAGAEVGERRIDVRDQSRDIAYVDVVVAHMCSNNVRSKGDEGLGHVGIVVVHRFAFFIAARSSILTRVRQNGKQVLHYIKVGAVSIPNPPQGFNAKSLW